MIITTIEELRLCLPSHAIDHIDAFVGYIDNSEHETCCSRSDSRCMTSYATGTTRTNQ